MKNETGMVVFPNAKINIGLKVVSKRPDGFHNIETVFYPIGLCDILEVIIAHDGLFSFQSSGLPIPGESRDNLCVKAYYLLAEETKIPPVKIHLHKIIPMGAGTGGGSSDGAFMIRLLNDIFSLGLSDERMIAYATRLGSDCAFFIRNKPVVAQGRGDQLTPVNIDLSGYKVVLVAPRVHVNTREAYELLDSQISEHDVAGQYPALKANVDLPLDSWKDKLMNDFERPVFLKNPEIRKIKELLYAKGAVYASMTGSGAAVYGLFTDTLTDLTGLENDFVWMG